MNRLRHRGLGYRADTWAKPGTDVTWLLLMGFDLQASWTRLWELKQQNGTGRKKLESETGKDAKITQVRKTKTKMWGHSLEVRNFRRSVMPTQLERQKIEGMSGRQ